MSLRTRHLVFLSQIHQRRQSAELDAEEIQLPKKVKANNQKTFLTRKTLVDLNNSLVLLCLNNIAKNITSFTHLNIPPELKTLLLEYMINAKNITDYALPLICLPSLQDLKFVRCSEVKYPLIFF
jgi:hypothetical protein